MTQPNNNNWPLWTLTQYSQFNVSVSRLLCQSSELIFIGFPKVCNGKTAALSTHLLDSASLIIDSEISYKITGCLRV